MPNVYVQAAIVAAVGLGLAVWDSSRRPVSLPAPAEVKEPSARRSGPTPTPPNDAAGSPDAAPDPDRVAAPTNTPPATTAGATVIPGLDPAALGVNISLNEAWTLNENAQAVFLDVRAADVFAAGHIREARNLPFTDLTNATANGLAFLRAYPDRTQHFVIYCGGGDCHDSENVRTILVTQGFSNLHIFREGYPGWTGAGLPTERGADRGFAE
ncbi:MAG: hypothetical protein HRU70_03930 [Phycisphaeraceae bacterium]|nr:MAG: hypothetical protein HRU70_03930 [Phycisphaeraceae bacterium]